MALLAAAALSAEKTAPIGPEGLAGTRQDTPSHDMQNDTLRQPPAEAIATCSGKSAGDTCRFNDRDSVTSGVCDEKPGILSCAPARSDNASRIPEERTAREASTPLPVTTPGGTVPAIPGTMPSGTGTFVLTSDAGAEGGKLPDDYSCDGSGASPALSWSGVPDGTEEFALMMTTLPVDGSTRWNWVLYHIPVTATGIARNGSSLGILGTGNHGTVMMYDPPCSQGPGAKVYTFTLYALSASPELPANPEEVTGPALTSAISSITLDKAVLNLNHARAGQS